MLKVMLRLLLLIFIFSSVYCSTPETDVNKDVCKNLAKLEKFKSRSWYHSNGKTYDIEEYQFGGKGKVIVTLNSESLEYYFEQSDEKTVKLLKYDRSKNECTRSEIDNIFPSYDNFTISKRQVVNYSFYDFKNGIFGPSALWTMLLGSGSEIKNSDEKNKIREIDTQSCTVEIRRFGKFHRTFGKFYLPNGWNIFTKLKENDRLPIRLEMNSDRNPIDKKRSFAVKIDYFAFENIEENQIDQSNNGENFFIAPKVCDALNDKTLEIQMPSRLKMVLDRYDGLKENKESDYLERKKVILDQKDGFISFKDYNRDDLIRIYEPVNRLFFKWIKDDSCISRYNEELSEKEEVTDLIRELFELGNSKYFLAGKKEVRNSMNDVYKRINKKKINKRQYNKEIFTFYLLPVESSEEQTSIKYVPFRLEAEEYDGNDNKLIKSVIYNIYDFEKLDNEKLFEELDLSECVPEELTQELYLVAEKGENDNLVDKRDELKIEIRKLLQEVSEQIILYYPEVDIDLYRNEIIARVKMIDIANPLVHFRKASKVKIKEDKKINLKTVNSYIECAGETLKNLKSVGFQYCHGDKYKRKYCDVIIELENNTFEVKQNDPENCVTNEKINTDRSIASYLSLSEKINKIKIAIGKKRFVVSLGDKSFTFLKLQRIKDEEKIDRSNLFEEKAELKKKKFKESEAKKKLEYEDGIRNLETCYEACVDPKNEFDCDSFTFCSKFENELFDCQLGSMFSEADKSQRKDIKDFFEDDDECNTYLVSSLNHFKEHTNKKLKEEDKETKTGAVILQKYDETDGNECALFCLNRNRESSDAANHCSTIEVCNEDSKPTCRLSSTQTLWDDDKTMGPNDNCNIFSVKHTLNFHSVGKEKIYQFVEEKKDTLDACATVCDSVTGCDKFNFCQQEQGNLCRYLSDEKDKEKKDTVLDSEELGCVTYVHRNKLIGAPQSKKEIIEKETNDGTGFKAGSTIGFIFLALFIGLVIGSLAFYVQKVYFKKSSDRNELIGFSTIREESEEL